MDIILKKITDHLNTTVQKFKHIKSPDFYHRFTGFRVYSKLIKSLHEGTCTWLLISKAFHELIMIQTVVKQPTEYGKK